MFLRVSNSMGNFDSKLLSLNIKNITDDDIESGQVFRLKWHQASMTCETIQNKRNNIDKRYGD